MVVVDEDLKDSGGTIEVSLSGIKACNYIQIEDEHTIGMTLTARVGSVVCGLVEGDFESFALVTVSNV